jgi:hypothetical protein
LAEDKIRAVLEGLRGDVSIAGLCRKESIGQSLDQIFVMVFEATDLSQRELVLRFTERKHDCVPEGEADKGTNL